MIYCIVAMPGTTTHTISPDGKRVQIYIRNSDGFFDASRLCHAANKKWKHYHANKSTKHFLQALQRKLTGDVILESNKNSGSIASRGTWVCPEIAMHLSMWLSPDWAVEIACILAQAALAEAFRGIDEGIYETMIKHIEAEGARREVTKGYLYAVTAPHFVACKLGFWRGSLESLRKRYQTFLTSSMQMITREVLDAPEAEKTFLKRFASFCLEGEVHSLEGWDQYVEYITNL